MMYGIMLT